MDPKQILNFCLERGILLDKEVLALLSEATDFDSARLMIERIKEKTHQKIITRNIFAESMREFSATSSEEKPAGFEKLKIKLGLELEISKEYSPKEIAKEEIATSTDSVKITNCTTTINKKIEVDDFVNYYRNRFLKMKLILQSHPTLKNLISINKISGDRQGFSIICSILDKRVTKNGNLLMEVEDLTGTTRVLVNQNKPQIYKKAEDLCLDSVIGITGSGNKEITFANDIIFPDSFIHERKKSPFEEYAVFISDLQYGSKLFFKDNFNKFIDYLNGKIPNTPEVSKIKYLFILGDIVTGVGNYPEQEKDLEIDDLEVQFNHIAELLERIRKDITIIISPGNHDGVRLMEPQPVLDRKFAHALYDMDNVLLATNPCYVNIGQKNGFSGIDVLVYHGFSYFYYADDIPSLIHDEAKNAPDKIMAYLLKNRHLAPEHTSTQYLPSAEDQMVIDKVPDVFVSGHTHKCAVSFYNNILLISAATWEDMTENQRKRGNQPDFCKVPILNLKTGGIKILDFE
ncbi:MAG TPA: metallophosphoesterase [Candidatus Omnitrophota bacterium]|nr:metallophosphoesterase [Candidatus Omnitrophota bacterium]